MAYNNDVEFTRITEVRTCGLQYNDNSWCYEKVLVKNISRNKPHDAEQSKMMIAYFDSAGLSVNEFLEMPEIKHYRMSFYKSTHETRKYFVEKKKVSTYNGNEIDLGDIYMGRCEDDSAKLKISIDRNLGTSEDYDKLGANAKREFLYNECDPDWYPSKDSKELVKYYVGLRYKRNAKR
jgi:hypothetical protein